jgi:hypothetical protein
VVIHHPYHFEFPDHVLPLSSLVKKHQKANADSDERVRHDCDQQSLSVLVQPQIEQTSKKKDAKASKNAPQTSNLANPTRTCTVDNHSSSLPPSAVLSRSKQSRIHYQRTQGAFNRPSPLRHQSWRRERLESPLLNWRPQETYERCLSGRTREDVPLIHVSGDTAVEEHECDGRVFIAGYEGRPSRFFGTTEPTASRHPMRSHLFASSTLLSSATNSSPCSMSAPSVT